MRRKKIFILFWFFFISNIHLKRSFLIYIWYNIIYYLLNKKCFSCLCFTFEGCLQSWLVVNYAINNLIWLIRLLGKNFFRKTKVKGFWRTRWMLRRKVGSTLIRRVLESIPNHNQLSSLLIKVILHFFKWYFSFIKLYVFIHSNTSIILYF